jgi:hypothetical protein
MHRILDSSPVYWVSLAAISALTLLGCFDWDRRIDRTQPKYLRRAVLGLAMISILAFFLCIGIAAVFYES